MRTILSGSGASFSGEHNQYRLTLHRIWDGTKGCVMFVMLNPSTADDRQDDPTIRRCIGFAKSWGFGGIYVCNLYSYITKDPAELSRLAKAGYDIVGPYNDFSIRVLYRDSCKLAVFAWGNSYPGCIDRANRMRELIPDAHYLRLTTSGHPAHPLYLKGDIKPVSFNTGDLYSPGQQL